MLRSGVGIANQRAMRNSADCPACPSQTLLRLQVSPVWRAGMAM
jgi:hypothetical protein